MKKKLKMYLSFPITGRNIKDVKAYAKRIKQIWEAKGYDVITPFEVVRDDNAAYSFCMGKDVETILECDGIIMCDNWFLSKGCRIENFVAQVYGKMIRVDINRYMGRLDNGTCNQI